MLKKVIKKVAPGVVESKRALFEKLDDIRGSINHVHVELTKHDTRIDRLKAALKRVEPYQPIYGLPDLVPDAKRSSRDRCEQIFNTLGNNVTSLRMLDIGSSLGYVSFFFADRGAKTEGWEFNPANIDVTRLAQEVNGIYLADFKTKEFNTENAAQIRPTDFDVAIMLNVAHHITHHHGFAYTQKLMKLLTDRVPIVIVELAQKGEDKNLFWDAAQPKDALEIFKLCDVHVELLGEFSNHLSKKTRPLYKVTRKHVTVGGRPYAVSRDVNFEAYSKSPMRTSGSTRRYYIGQTAFIKEYILEPGVDSGHRAQIFNELSTALKFNLTLKNTHIPRLLDYEVNRDNVKLAFERIDGHLLGKLDAGKIDAQSVASQVAACLADIEQIGLHHNDIRSWNIMVAGKRVYLIDYGLTDALPAENNAIAFLWMLHAAVTGEREGSGEGKEKLPPRTVFKDYPKILAVYDKVSKGETAFAKINQMLHD